MGFMSSPYQTVQGILHAEEKMLGNADDSTNIFRWDRVELNLLGACGYTPSSPWVAKMRDSDEKLACDLFIYVDDIRTIGNSESECWKVLH